MARKPGGSGFTGRLAFFKVYRQIWQMNVMNVMSLSHTKFQTASNFNVMQVLTNVTSQNISQKSETFMNQDVFLFLHHISSTGTRSLAQLMVAPKQCLTSMLKQAPLLKSVQMKCLGFTIS